MSDPICNERGIPQSECPPFCPHDFGSIGPDGFTRLAAYVSEYVNDSPAALRVRVTEAQGNALEMARKADAAERRAEEAEFHVEQLRDARDRAERRADDLYAEADRLRDILAEVRRVFDLQCPPMPPEKYVDHGAWMAHSWWNTVLGGILNREGVGTGAGEGATGQDTGTAWVTRSADCPEAPAQAHPLGPGGFTRLDGGRIEYAECVECGNYSLTDMDDCPVCTKGCDCTELCSMGTTCPGGMLAGLPGSGCWRERKSGDAAYDRLRGVDGLSQTSASAYDEGWNAAVAYMSPDHEGPDDPPNPYVPAEADECPGLYGEHHWLDRPESDTRECLVCGVDG